MTARRPVEIVILGGGYTAVWGYRAIARRLRRRIVAGEVRITMVAASRHHAFHGWTGEVLGGLVRYERTRTPLTQLAPLAEVVHGRVTAIDPADRTVTYAGDGGTGRLRFDHLLIGVGSADATGRIPGLTEHGWSVKTDDGLLATRRHLWSLPGRAASAAHGAEQERLLTVVVAGGGFAGAEMAGAIAEYLRLRHRGRTGEVRPQVVLLHGGDRLIPEIRPRFDRLADYGTARLDRLGVEVRFGSRLAAVSPAGAMLDDGTVIPAATVVSAVGQAQVPLPGTEAVLRGADGRMLTDGFLRTSLPGVWAGGDAAAVPHGFTGTVCPPNALWAIHHGKRVGDNIARTVAGKRPRRFRFPGLGQAAGFGIGRGAGELYGLQLTGRVGWVARWLFFHWYMPSRRQALGTMSEWLRIPFAGRHDLRHGDGAGDGHPERNASTGSSRAARSAG